MGTRRRTGWEAIVEAALREPGVEAYPSQFSARPALWVDGREFAHGHDDGHLDLRLTRSGIRAARARIAADPGIRRRGTGDWIEIDLAGRKDLGPVLELLGAAVRANRRSGLRGVPDPAALARRRRAHGGSTGDLPASGGSRPRRRGG